MHIQHLLFGPNEREKRLLFGPTGGPETQSAPEREAAKPTESAETTDLNPQAQVENAVAEANNEIAGAEAQIGTLPGEGAAGDATTEAAGEQLDNVLNGEVPKAEAADVPAVEGEAPPEEPLEPPKTNAERIDRDLQKAEDTLHDPEKKGWEKLVAAITFILLIIERIKMQLAGTLQDPPKNAKTETATTAPEEGEANAAENAPEAPLENEKRLKAEVLQHPNGVDGLITTKNEEISASLKSNDGTIDQIDTDLHGLKQNKVNKQADIESQKLQLAEARQGLANAPNAETKEKLQTSIETLEEKIKESEIDLKGIEEKIQNNEARRATLMQKKGNETTQKLQADVEALNAMRKEAEALVARLNAGLVLAAKEISDQLGGKIKFLQNLQQKLKVELDLKTLEPHVVIGEDVKQGLADSLKQAGADEKGAIKDDLADGKINDVEALTKVLEKLHKEAKPAA